ncbi:MAG TPA: DUF6194 family protein [Chloroflexia bacterium]|nr:DUF6194 family protein [Chloroflexia bacterium]
MDAAEVSQYITTTLPDVDVVTGNGDSFFFYTPDPSAPDHMFPFATLVTSNGNDPFSDLDRPGVFRLNIGVGKETFRGRFGTPALPSDRDGSPLADPPPGEYDFTALDRVMPHPVYGHQLWVCVLNPGAATFATDVQPLLAEAYDRAVIRYQRKQSHAHATAPQGGAVAEEEL